MATYIKDKYGRVFLKDVIKETPDGIEVRTTLSYYEFIRFDDIVEETDNLLSLLYRFFEIRPDGTANILNEFDHFFFNEYLEVNPNTKVFGVTLTVKDGKPHLKTVAEYNREARKWVILV